MDSIDADILYETTDQFFHQNVAKLLYCENPLIHTSRSYN